MTIIQRLSAFFFSIYLFLLWIPYGDLWTRAEFVSCTLDNGAVVCEATEAGPSAAFGVVYRNDYRPLPPDQTGDLLTFTVYKAAEENGEPAVVPADVRYSLDTDKKLIKEGENFNFAVTVTFPAGTAPGAYSISVKYYYNEPDVFTDALIVP